MHRLFCGFKPFLAHPTELKARRPSPWHDLGHSSSGSPLPKQRPRHPHPPQITRPSLGAQFGHGLWTANSRAEGFHHAAGMADELLRSDGEALEDLRLGLGDHATFVRMHGARSGTRGVSSKETRVARAWVMGGARVWPGTVKSVAERDGNQFRFSFRGLAPHKFTPMLGVHKYLRLTQRFAPAS